jgi:hypothetical protein
VLLPNPERPYPLNPKETTMLYKTMVLELLQQRPEMRQHLKHQRLLRPALELYANALKRRHDVWKELLTQDRPQSSERQIATEALELALQELEQALPSASLPDESDTLSLDATMAFIRRHTPPA